MHSNVRVHLFGAAGERTTEVSTRGGFPTRHIKAQCETGPSTKPVSETQTQETSHHGDLDRTTSSDEKHATSVLDILKQMHPSVDGWLILDEIVFVATAEFGMTTSHNKLRDALRPLYRDGQVEHQKNRFGQDCFRLPSEKPPNLKALLVEVDAIMEVQS